MKIVYSFLLLISCHLILFSQKPYFQQKIEYQIYAKLDTTLKALHGNISLVYINNSPDTLNYIYFHLYPNATRSKSRTELAKQLIFSGNWSLYFAKQETRGYIDSLNFKVDGLKADFKVLKDSLDIGILYLHKPLLPKQQITIESPFYVKIPTCGHTRMGYKNGIYSITQWYPKPAVYDKEGWHPYPYLENGEFYSEFGTYKVKLEVPSNLTIAATGILKTDSEKKRIEQIIKQTKLQQAFIDNSTGYKILDFEQDSVHDFAWFASSKYMIVKDSISLNNRTVFCWAYFIPSSYTLLKNSAQYVAQSIEYYSKRVGNYPYTNATVVETPGLINGGMEYPTITNIGEYANSEDLFFVILHEIGHNWFYGMLASNERKYPWIDEGINSFYDNYGLVENQKKPEKEWQYIEHFFNFERLPNVELSNYFYFAGSAKPIGLRSELYSSIEYYYNAYYYTSTLWSLLKEQLGSDTYEQFMQSFFSNYSFKHIYPEDVVYHLSSFTDKPTDWFFYYLHSTHRSDYKINKCIRKDNEINLIVKNKKSVITPYTVTVYNKDSVIHREIRNGKLIDTIRISEPGFTKAVLNDASQFVYYPEHKYSNNFYINRAILPRLNKVSVQLGGIINKPDRYSVSLLPLVSFTETDGAMIGLLFYNPVIPYPSYHFRILPLYSPEHHQINWNCYGEKNFLVNRKLKYLNIYAGYKKFMLPKNDYQKTWNATTAGIEMPFVFQQYHKKTFLTLSANWTAATLSYFPYSTEHYINAELNYIGFLSIYPIDVSLISNNHHDFSKLSLNGKIFIPYSEKKKGIDISLFGGLFLFNHSKIYLYNFFLSGRNGVKDYTYNEAFISRYGDFYSHNFWSRQFVLSEGQFSTYTPIQSNRWMTSLRISVALPIPPPIYFYGVTGTYFKAGRVWQGSTKFPYEIGIEIRPIKNIFAVYFPMTMSDDIKTISDNYSRHYFDKVRFMIRFNLLNPFYYSRKVHELF